MGPFGHLQDLLAIRKSYKTIQSFYDNKVPLKYVRAKFQSLSTEQKGELMLEATRKKNFNIFRFAVIFGAPIGYANKNGTTGLMIVSQNIYNKVGDSVSNPEIDFDFAKMYLSGMTKEEINLQDKHSFKEGYHTPHMTYNLLKKVHEENEVYTGGNMTALAYLCASFPNLIEVKLKKPYTNENGFVVKTKLIEDPRACELIKLYRKYGADVSIKDIDGLDCMKHAIAFGNLSVVKALSHDIIMKKGEINHGADFTQTDNYGNTDYMYAVSRSHVDGLLEFLEEQHVDPTVRNIFNQTALDVSSHAWSREKVTKYTSVFESNNQQEVSLSEQTTLKPQIKDKEL